MKINREFLKKHRTAIIAVCAVIAVLTAAFIYDGVPSGTDTERAAQYTIEPTAEPTADAEIDTTAEPTTDPESTSEPDGASEEQSADTIPETAITEENRPENTGSGKMTAEEKTQLAAELEAALAPLSTTAPTPAPTTTPMQAEDNEGIHYCTISVRCDTILTHMAWLDEAKRVLIPADGVIYENTAAEFSEGESVFDVLLRELRANNIHFEYENTAVYKSSYIEGIANIYEYDCGELSGWMYNVNGVFPGYASSEYILSDGDVAEIVYTCDLGRDVGAYRTDGAANE